MVDPAGAPRDAGAGQSRRANLRAAGPRRTGCRCSIRSVVAQPVAVLAGGRTTGANFPAARSRSAFSTTPPRRRRPKACITLTKPTSWPRAATTARAHYLLIAELVPPPLSERIPGDILWTLKLGTVFSALVCLVIAHYLTKPIERLRDATHEMAKGNLDIHVGKNLGQPE